MTDLLDGAEGRLLDDLADTPRGPRRTGLFAVWLFVRLAGGLLPPDPVPAREHAGRLRESRRRLSSLSVPAPLRRALTGGLQDLEAGDAKRAAQALRLLVPPVRETLGAAAGDAVHLAARDALAASRTQVR